jgi:hypothetical protein
MLTITPLMCFTNFSVDIQDNVHVHVGRGYFGGGFFWCLVLLWRSVLLVEKTNETVASH